MLDYFNLYNSKEQSKSKSRKKNKSSQHINFIGSSSKKINNQENIKPIEDKNVIENIIKNNMTIYSIYILSKYENNFSKIGIAKIGLYDKNNNEIFTLYSNANFNKDNNEEENVELNISNLEIDINEINNDNNYIQNEDELVMSGSHSNEFAKKYLSSKSKSFIKFSNNLTARVAARNLKNSPSYILALCPELLERFDKKNVIRDNYAVTDAISEEMESDTFTPRQSEKMDYSINKNTIDYNQSIHTNEYQVNNTLRNKDITDSSKFEYFLDKKEKIEKIETK